MNVAYIQDDEYFESQKPSFLSNLKTMHSKHRVLTWIVISVFVLSFILLIILCRCTAKEKALQKDPGDIAAGLPTSLSSMKSSKKASNNSVNAKGSKTITASSKGSTKSSKKKTTKSQGNGSPSSTGGNTSTPSQSSGSVSPSSTGGNTSTSPQSPGNGNQSSSGGNTSTSTLSSVPVPTEHQKKVDEIIKLVRSAKTLAEIENSMPSQRDRNEFLEEVIIECTKEIPENNNLSGEMILHLLTIDPNLIKMNHPKLNLHLMASLFKTSDTYDSISKRFWNFDFNVSSSFPNSKRSETVKNVIDINNSIFHFSLNKENLIRNLAAEAGGQFSGKLWYEYVVECSEDNQVKDLVHAFDSVIPSNQGLKLDELFAKLPEMDYFSKSWSSRMADSFLDYLIKTNKLQQSHLVSYMGVSTLKLAEKERRFSKICTLITDLGTYQKILNAIKSRYGDSVSEIPIFSLEILGIFLPASQNYLFKTLVDLGFDTTLKKYIEKLSDKDFFYINEIPKDMQLDSFPQAKEAISNILRNDSKKASDFFKKSNNNHRTFLIECNFISDYTDLLRVTGLSKEILEKIDEKGKYDEIYLLDFNSSAFSNLLALNSKHNLPNLHNALLTAIEGKNDDDINNLQISEKNIINDKLIQHSKLTDKQLYKTIEILAKKNLIQYSGIFPKDFPQNCQNLIIDSANVKNINVLLENSVLCEKLFDNLAKSSYLTNVLPLITSTVLTDDKLKKLDEKDKYLNIPSPLEDTVSFKNLFNLRDKFKNLKKGLDKSLKEIDISDVKDADILIYIAADQGFADKIKQLTSVQLKKIYVTCPNFVRHKPSLKSLPQTVLTDLISLAIENNDEWLCSNVLQYLKEVPFDICEEIIAKFNDDTTIKYVIEKCKVEDGGQILYILDWLQLQKKPDLSKALFTRNDIWNAETICFIFKQKIAPKYYEFLMPKIFENVDNFDSAQWQDMQFQMSSSFGPFKEFTPDVFKKIYPKNKKFSLDILDKLCKVDNPISFLPLLEEFKLEAEVFDILKRLIFNEKGIYGNIMKLPDFENYEELLKSILSQKPYFYGKFNDEELDLIKNKYGKALHEKCSKHK